ncbi:MAG: peptidoglycan D,D-transpeptidase FtsI family protein [Bacillota bacterium]
MERTKRRLVWTLTILVFFFICAAARTGYIQVVQGNHYARKALASETDGVALEDYSRGQILDRHLRPLTGLYRSNRILVFPAVMEDPEAVARGLSAITGADFFTVTKTLSEKKPALLPFRITADQSRLIQESGWEGVLVAPYTCRYGPSPLAAHVVGHMGRIRDLRELEELNRSGEKTYRLSDWVGRKGLEHFYEGELRGQYPSGFAGLYTDALGKPLPGIPVMVDTGLGDFTRSDVVTTIDADIQEMVERVMDRHIKKGAVVVMDKSSGDILAIASRPAYNPDPGAGDLVSSGEDERFVNQALSLFQPGSIFKVVVAAAALSGGVVRPDTRFYCRGSLEKPVRCWKDEGHGSITLAEAFAQSCNPVFVRLGQELGPRQLIGYARALGLDNQGILGYPAAPDRRQDLNLIAGQYNLVSSSVGQGPVLATPLQITAMINTVANEGLYLQPRLVSEIRPARGAPRKIRPGEPVRAVSPEVARQIGEMMVMVTRQGVGRRAWVSQGGTAGKTGSAQLGGSREVVNAWFSGYGPLDNPRFTVTVLVREGVSGGETAAPVFREIMENIIMLSGF